MGNSESEYELNHGIKDFISEQFERVKKDSTRTYITITELLSALHPEDFPIQFKHLAVLYICDQDHDGIFSFEDIELFGLWIQVNLPGIQAYQFKAQLQARTAASMIEDIEKKAGENQLVIWFVRMLLSGHRRRQIHGQTYIIIDSVKTMYEIFNVQMMTDMDIQSFFYLIKRSSEELGYKIEEIIENDEEEEYIPTLVCEEFVRSFVKGILKTLREIGYNSTEM